MLSPLLLLSLSYLHRLSSSTATETGKTFLETDLAVVGRFHSPFPVSVAVSALGSTRYSPVVRGMAKVVRDGQVVHRSGGQVCRVSQ